METDDTLSGGSRGGAWNEGDSATAFIEGTIKMETQIVKGFATFVSVLIVVLLVCIIQHRLTHNAPYIVSGHHIVFGSINILQ